MSSVSCPSAERSRIIIIVVVVVVITAVKKNIQDRDIRQKEVSVPFRGHSKTLSDQPDWVT